VKAFLAALCAVFLTATMPSSVAASGSRFDVYLLAVGSSDYVSAPAGWHGFGRLDGANKSARLVADAFLKAGARRAIVLTSSSGAYVSAADVSSALRRLKAVALAQHPANPLLVFYFAGHGVSEGLGWNQFLIPGDFVYRKDPKTLTVEDLRDTTIHAGTLVDALESSGLPYAAVLDTCTTGTPTELTSPLLTASTNTSLGSAQAAVRALNEFRDPNPVLFSATPGSDVPLAPDPRNPNSVLSVGPLGRRILIAFDRRASSHRDLSLATLVFELGNAAFDATTRPAVTHAQLQQNAARGIAFDGPQGVIETRTGSAGTALTRSGSAASFDGYPALRIVSGRLVYSGEPGEYLSQGRRVEVTSRTATFRMSNDPIHGINITIDLGTPGDSYDFGISGANRAPLRAGTYKGAQRHLFQDPGHPGLDFSVPDRGCNEVRGDFTVKEIHYDAVGTVTALSADFTQYCDTNRTALHGSIDVRRAAR
jgi:hypothetical protein